MDTRWPFPSVQHPQWLSPPGAPDPYLATCRDAVRSLLDGGEGGDEPSTVARALSAASELAERIDWVLLALVGEARGDGLSWEQVGEALGVSKQAAHKRFSHYVDAALHAAAGTAVPLPRDGAGAADV